MFVMKKLLVDLDWCHTEQKSSSVLLVWSLLMLYLADHTKKAQWSTSMSECSWKVLWWFAWEWCWLWDCMNRWICGLTDLTQCQDAGHKCNQFPVDKCQNNHHEWHRKSCHIDQSWQQNRHTNHDICWLLVRTHKICYMSDNHHCWDKNNMDQHMAYKVGWHDQDTEWENTMNILECLW